MKIKILLLVLLFYSIKLVAQYAFIQTNFSKYGPCHNYLNILGYTYSFTDLKKDTLKYPATRNQFGAVFIQNKNALLNAKFFDKNGNIVSGGNFKNGNGQLIIHQGTTAQLVYNFLNGKLNDSTLQIVNGKIDGYLIFKENTLVKEESRVITRTVANYDENGILHDSTLFYGHPPRPLYLFFYIRYYDSYHGKLYMVNIYDHGNLKEQLFYRKDGTIKKQETFNYVPKNHYKKPYKSCL